MKPKTIICFSVGIFLSTGHIFCNEILGMSIDDFVKSRPLENLLYERLDFRTVFYAKEDVLKAEKNHVCLFDNSNRSRGQKISQIDVGESILLSDLLVKVGYPNWSKAGPSLKLIKKDQVIKSPTDRLIPKNAEEMRVFLSTVIMPGDILYLPMNI